MTFVEEFIARIGGAPNLDSALGGIEHFFEEIFPRAALRLCCVGLSGRSRPKVSWAPMEKEITKLFGGSPAESIVNNHKIKRFAYALFDQRKPKNVHAYIGLLVCHLLSMKPKLKEQPAIAEGLAICDFIQLLDRYCSSMDPKDLEVPSPSRGPAAAAAPSVRRTFGIGDHDADEIAQRFFNRHAPILGEESYYACYRFSMSKPEIVKTFLTMLSPTPEIGHFTFRHVYGYEPEGGSAVIKVAAGDVMYLDGAFYFLGPSARRLEMKTERPQGLKLIAIHERSLVPNPRLLSGLFMSASLEGEPIVGRLALLHLGYRKDGEITEVDVKPRVIDTLKDFKKDLADASAASVYGRLPKLDERILRLIDNQTVRSRSPMNVTHAMAAAQPEHKQP